MIYKSLVVIAIGAAAAVGSVMQSGQRQEGAGAGAQVVSMDWLRQRLDAPGGEPLAIIAADRDGATFEGGHIPTARLLPHHATLDTHGHRMLGGAELAAALARAGARDNARIVIYGDDPLSVGWLYMALASIGHADHTVVLDGNARAWRAAGHPVATGPSADAPGPLAVRKPADEPAVDRAWVRTHMNDPATRLLDVRSPREWDGGIIPGSTPLLWQDLYDDVGMGRLKSAAALRAVFERAGVRPGQTAVTYCAVGMRASLAYFAARLAGVPARVYVGSWADWTADPGSPIAKRQ